MATLSAQKVKLYKETYEFLERFNRDAIWKISLLNAIKRSGKKNYLGTPLIGFAWIIFKKSPQFAASHGYKLLDSLRTGKFDEFANTLDDLFTKFWKSMQDREGMQQEVERVVSGEIEHPGFISDDDHTELSKIEGLPEGPARQQAFENFTGPRMEQFHPPQFHPPTVSNTSGSSTLRLRPEGVEVKPPHKEDTPEAKEVQAELIPGFTPGVFTPIESGAAEGLPEVHTGGEEKTVVPEAFSQWKDIQQPFIPSGQEEFKLPPAEHLRGEEPGLPSARHLGGEEKTRGFQFKSILKPFKSIRLPTSISTGIKKFITRNLTPLRIASVFTGGLGAIVGYGATNTALGAAGGGVVGGSLPTLIKQRGFGQMVLSGVSKAGTTGGNFLTGLSGGGGGRIGGGGGFFGRAAGGVGKKAALLALLGFVLLAAFLVGFAPAPGTPGGGSIATGSGTLTGGSCPDQATIDQNKKDPISCKYFGLGVNLFNTSISQTAIDFYTNKYSGIFINAGKGDLEQFKTRVNYIITKSKGVGINPVLALGYWKTESNFSTVGSRDLGCSPDAIDFYEQVDCKLGINEFSNPTKNPITNCARSKDAESIACRTLKSIRRNLDITNPIKYPISTFDDFAEAYGSRDPNLDCTPEGCKVNNNCVSTYNKLVEVAKELNACTIATPTPIPVTPGTGGIVSCPVAGGTIKTPSYQKDPVKGHCGSGYTRPCKCGTNGRRAKAIDIPTKGSDVILPNINGEKVRWLFKVAYGVEAVDGGGSGFTFEADTTVDGKPLDAVWTLDMLHMATTGLNTNSRYPSGTAVGKTQGPHVHTTIGKNITNNSNPGVCIGGDSNNCPTDCDPGWLPSDFMCK